MKLFVYDTMKSRHYRHYLLIGQFIESCILDGYCMYKINYFPVIYPGKGSVHGELYKIKGDFLTKLDFYNLCPLQMHKELVCINGHYALTYVYNKQPFDKDKIPSGRW